MQHYDPNCPYCDSDPVPPHSHPNDPPAKTDISDSRGIEIQVWGYMPDWSIVCSPAHAEKEFYDFKFKGTGWYRWKKDTLLVLPFCRGEKGMPDLFRFCIYNDRDPREAFEWIANAPERGNGPSCPPDCDHRRNPGCVLSCYED